MLSLAALPVLSGLASDTSELVIQSIARGGCRFSWSGENCREEGGHESSSEEMHFILIVGDAVAWFVFGLRSCGGLLDKLSSVKEAG